MRCDVHTHAWPAQTAARAVAQMEARFGLFCEGSGALATLVAEEEAAGMDMACLLCCAALPVAVRPINRYAVSVLKTQPKILPFGTLHPGLASWEQELDILHRCGAGGIKMHPDYQGFRLDDRALWPLFEAMSGRFCLCLHIGSRKDSATAPSTPRQLKAVARAFPGLHIIGAHLGGFHMWQDVLETFAHSCPDNLWFDTSNVSAHADRGLLKELLRTLPGDRLCFGTDWPFFRIGGEIARLKQRAGLSDSQFDALASNAEPLLRHYYPALRSFQGTCAKSSHSLPASLPGQTASLGYAPEGGQETEELQDA